MECSPFGSPLSSFMERCDRRHPDLGIEPIRSFIEGADQVSRAADLCIAEGLHEPLKIICSNAPKTHPNILCMTRVLKEDHRRIARFEKSASSISLLTLRDEVRRLGDDLPGSFDLFRGPEAPRRLRAAAWDSASATFDLIGCASMSSASRAMAEECEPGLHGYFRLPIRRAAQILCRSRGMSPSSAEFVSVEPAVRVRLPAAAAEAVEASEGLVAGFPFFDHHVLIRLSPPLDSEGDLARDYCVLGERDGECYFVFSD